MPLLCTGCHHQPSPSPHSPPPPRAASSRYNNLAMPPVPPSDQMRVTGSGRRKVALAPGRSQLDWVRNSPRLPPPARHTVTLAELRAHKARGDAWLAISGNVFDVTPYLDYHPGGVEMLLVGAGKDATVLFNKYHAWVNPDFMLARCYIGPLDVSVDRPLSDGEDDHSEDDDCEEEKGGKEAADQAPDAGKPVKNAPGSTNKP